MELRSLACIQTAGAVKKSSRKLSKSKPAEPARASRETAPANAIAHRWGTRFGEPIHGRKPQPSTSTCRLLRAKLEETTPSILEEEWEPRRYRRRCQISRLEAEAETHTEALAAMEAEEALGVIPLEEPPGLPDHPA